MLVESNEGALVARPDIAPGQFVVSVNVEKYFEQGLVVLRFAMGAHFY